MPPIDTQKTSADVFAAIENRRSQKKFLTTPVAPETLKRLFDAAVLAPNHKMTQPWGFLVLGEKARRAYGEAKALRKVGDPTDAPGAEKAARIIDEIMAIPAIVAVTQKLADDPVRREEDYAAVFMAIQNLLLAATALNLGTKIHTGDIMDDVAMRREYGLEENERIVAIIDIGEVGELLAQKKRIPAEEKTRWLD